MLMLRQRDPDRLEPREALGGPDQEAAPAAADVEHAHAVAELELVEDEVELGELRLVERGVGRAEVGA